jgi:hypothetical protein
MPRVSFGAGFAATLCMVVRPMGACREKVMSYQIRALAIVAAFALFALIAPLPSSPTATARQEPPKDGVVPDMVKWNLIRLHKEPFKLIKATPNAATGQVRFVVEFTRALDLPELFDWDHRGGPVVFRFLDEDGVVMRTLKPQLEGELISEKGARIRLVLQMPDARTLELTREITAE